MEGALQPTTTHDSGRSHARERREAILKALEIISSVSRGLAVPDSRHKPNANLRVL